MKLFILLFFLIKDTASRTKHQKRHRRSKSSHSLKGIDNLDQQQFIENVNNDDINDDSIDGDSNIADNDKENIYEEIDQEKDQLRYPGPNDQLNLDDDEYYDTQASQNHDANIENKNQAVETNTTDDSHKDNNHNTPIINNHNTPVINQPVNSSDNDVNNSIVPTPLPTQLNITSNITKTEKETSSNENIKNKETTKNIVHDIPSTSNIPIPDIIILTPTINPTKIELPKIAGKRNYLNKIIKISPPYVSPLISSTVEVEFELDISSMKEVYAQLGKQKIQCHKIASNKLECNVPPHDAGQYQLSVSFDDISWTKPYPLLYVSGFFINYELILKFGAIILGIILVLIFLLRFCSTKNECEKIKKKVDGSLTKVDSPLINNISEDEIRRRNK